MASLRQKPFTSIHVSWVSKVSQLSALCAFSVLFVTQAHAAATYPQWWIDQGVIENDTPPPAPTDPGFDAWMAANHAAALLGQAKHLAKSAYLTMEAAQAGSAGTEITNMVTGFSTAYEDNYVPMRLGQLKALAEPFYQAMNDVDFPITLTDGAIISNQTYPFPWPEPPLLPSDPTYDPNNPAHVAAYEAWLPNTTTPHSSGSSSTSSLSTSRIGLGISYRLWMQVRVSRFCSRRAVQL